MTLPTGDEMAERGTDRYMRSHGAQAPARAPVVEIPPGPSFEGSVGARIHELERLLLEIAEIHRPIKQSEVADLWFCPVCQSFQQPAPGCWTWRKIAEGLGS